MAENEENLTFSNAEKDINSEDDDAEINQTVKTTRIKKNVVNDDTGGVPIDRGWAWVVLAGNIFTQVHLRKHNHRV